MQTKLFSVVDSNYLFFSLFMKGRIKREIHVMFSTHIFAIFLLEEEEKKSFHPSARYRRSLREEVAHFSNSRRGSYSAVWQEEGTRSKKTTRKAGKKNSREIYLANIVACDEESGLLLVGWDVEEKDLLYDKNEKW